MWMILYDRILTLDAKKGYNLPIPDDKIQCEMPTNKMYIKNDILCAVRFLLVWVEIIPQRMIQ